jgi:hypothetical protein
MCTLWTRPNSANHVINDDPPVGDERHRQPVHGMILSVIPTFWNTCHSSIVKTPGAEVGPSMSRDRWAMRQIRTSTIDEREQQGRTPDQAELLPEGGEREVGPDRRDVAAVVSGPCSHPLPKMPPVPTAFTALSTW